MSDLTQYGNTICSTRSMQIEGFDSLEALAFDLRLSWKIQKSSGSDNRTIRKK